VVVSQISTKERILAVGLPVLIIIDSITTYIGINLGYTEHNPIIAPVARTWQHIVLAAMMAFLMLIVLLQAQKLGTLKHKWVRIYLTCILTLYVIVQLSNLYNIIRAII